MSEDIAGVDAEKSSDGAPEYGCDRKSALAPEGRDIASEKCAYEEKEKNELFGHNVSVLQEDVTTFFMAQN